MVLSVLVLLRPRLWAGSGSQARWGGLKHSEDEQVFSLDGIAYLDRFIITSIFLG